MKSKQVWLFACMALGLAPAAGWADDRPSIGRTRISDLTPAIAVNRKAAERPVAWNDAPPPPPTPDARPTPDSKKMTPTSAANDCQANEPCEAGESECGEEACCPPFWQHRTGVYGEFIYWSPREMDLRYATRVDGTIASAIPLAPPATADPTYQPGFRVGGAYALDCEQSITVDYTYYRSDTTDQISATGNGQWIRPDTVHPNTLTVASDRLLAVANYDTWFQMIDLNYKRVLSHSDDSVVNYLFGVRYAELDHDFTGTYTNLDVITVTTDINFTGIGPRLGLDAERLLTCNIFGYGRVFGALLMGEFRSDYLQQQNTIITQATTGFDDDRVVPQLELEFGLGWQSKCGRLRLSAGYYVGVWFNTVTTAELIEAAQADSFNSVSDTIVFDGLTARAELRF
ncbi:MAG: hypothetical protein GXP27_22205 [Planctomycetes bacterium]|nr:hypothetical protein [Planctomycetota bacterium]